MAAPTGKFVGRLRELETLRGTLDQVLARHGRIVLLAGEPGIGKTRMAQELARLAESHGATLWGHCPEEAGAPPYWPWVQIIRAALRAADARALLRDVGSGASDIADIVPEVRDRLPELERSAPLGDPSEARFRMFESSRQRRPPVPAPDPADRARRCPLGGCAVATPPRSPRPRTWRQPAAAGRNLPGD